MATTPRAVGRKTPWFPAGTKPVRPGVYQTRSPYTGLISYQRWNGCRWCAFAPTIWQAQGAVQPSITRPKPAWRGLTSEAR